MLEFTLVGIPLVFALVSIAEMSRGMWTYATLAYSVKDGVRFAAVKGINCSIAPNACTATVAQVANRIKQSGVGLIPRDLNLTFDAPGGNVVCTLPQCLNNQTPWPASRGNLAGMSIHISATYPFRSAIAMFWPGTGRGLQFGTFNLPASAQESIQF